MYRVLLIEDDKTNLCFYEKMKEWEKAGFVIAGEARNGLQALELLESESFDLLIVDVMMPVMNGLEFLEELQKRDRESLCVIASNYNEFEYVRQGMRLGAMDYLLKPVMGEELYSCLNRMREKLEEKKEANLVEQIFVECGADIHAGFVQKVMQHFEEHPDLNLQDIADAFHLSKDYFGKLFKRQMQENYNQFVLKFKMEYAKKLLCMKDDKIYEISDKLGYRTTDYFSKLFREYTGMTPAQYRKTYQSCRFF